MKMASSTGGIDHYLVFREPGLFRIAAPHVVSYLL